MLRIPNLPSLFITGTDTAVGKTVVTGILAWLYDQTGIKVGIEKPVVTGVSLSTPGFSSPDLDFFKDIIPNIRGPVTSYRFEPAVSPHLAAAMAGVSIDPARIESDHHELLQACDAVLVEGAGGILVPLNETCFMSDLALRLRLPIIIVSRPSLGTINHTLLTVECARNKGLQIAGIIIDDYPPEPNPAELDNPGIIERLSGFPVLAVVPHIEDFSIEDRRTSRLAGIAAKVDKQYHLLAKLESM
ncbi:MAG: dethiobiotin synthase [Pseudomonadota bacterium]